MTPALFGLIGYFVDRQLGTAPLFTLGLTVFVAVYVVWKLCHGYNAEMDRLEGERIERNVLDMLRTEDQ
ncbi:MAG: AtpZ/AtpI family protein [Actinomycetia bacterium]|nr:AtpZ/AtpI family protein [Actinomycetes bacterium]MCP4225466.1 AtpZ/AtpI family protein [Actinomycetes bacterium]MCP5031879.1 AtpZ/AtpI family protein [Actinomycetes bacterium]